MDIVGFLTSVASSLTAAVLFSMSQRLKGRLKALQLPPPVRVDETRNAILLVGIGGVGKTSLIKALTHDLAAEQDTIGPFKIYKHVEELGNEPSGIKRTNLYFADYRWQNLTDLIGHASHHAVTAFDLHELSAEFSQARQPQRRCILDPRQQRSTRKLLAQLLGLQEE